MAYPVFIWKFDLDSRVFMLDAHGRDGHGNALKSKERL